MIIGSITITSLDPIGNAVAGDTLIPVVNMDGVPTTQKMTVANLMQAGVGANLGPVANVKITGGTNGYVLQTDGAGNLSWTAQTGGGGGNGSPGGSSTQVQFNDAGAFAGNTGFTFNKTAGALAVAKVDTADVYHLDGVVVENSDLTHGATAALVLPANGNTTVPVQVNNTYGNVQITTGITSGSLKNWVFDNTGNLTAPGNLSVVGNANIGNIGTAGVVTATGNVRGGNLNTAGIVSATGAIRGASLYVSGTGTAINASSGNVLTNEVTGTKFNFLNGSYTATITGGGATSNYSLNLPATAGTNGQVLTTDGTGNLSWSAGGGGNTFSAITMSSTPSGPSNQINYGLGNLVAWNDGGWALGVYDGANYGTEGMRLSPGIEGNVEVILPANQDAANNSLQLNNYAGNVQVNANNHYWTFDNTGNLVVPGSITSSLSGGFPFGGGITNITTGNPTVIVTLDSAPFPDAVTGRVTITGVAGATEANGTRYYRATNDNEFQLFNDAACTIPTSGIGWGAYIGNGFAYSPEYNDLELKGDTVDIRTGDSIFHFTPTGDIQMPGGAYASGGYGRLLTNNGYTTLLSYGSDPEHGGPELDWSDATDPANVFGNSNVLRNTMYLNDGGLYVGLNENNNANAVHAFLRFDRYGALLIPEGNATTTSKGQILSNNENGFINLDVQFGIEPGKEGGVRLGTGAYKPVDVRAGTNEWRFDSDGSLTVPGVIKSIGSYTYRGFYAVLNQISGNDPSINQIVLSRSSSISGSNPTTDTDDDNFIVTGINGSNITAIVNLYGQSNSVPIDLESLFSFVRSYIDLVLYNGNTQRTTIGDIQTAFAANEATLLSTQNFAPDTIVNTMNFNGIQSIVPASSGTTTGTGTGAVFLFDCDPLATGSVDYNTTEWNYNRCSVPGTGYSIGEYITIPGTLLGGATPADDMGITVDSIDGSGGIIGFTLSGSMSQASYAQCIVQRYIYDGYSDIYDQGNFLGTDISRCVFTAYTDSNSNLIVTSVTSGALYPYMVFYEPTNQTYPMVIWQTDGVTEGGTGTYVCGGYDDIHNNLPSRTYTAYGMYYGVGETVTGNGENWGAGTYGSMIGSNGNGIFSMVSLDGSASTVSYAGNTGSDSSGTKAAVSQFAIGAEPQTLSLISSNYTWSFGTNGNLVVPGNINAAATGSATINQNITGITTGSNTVFVTLANNIFGAPVTGKVAISGVVGTVQANQTWWFGATDPNEIQLFTDPGLTIPADGTTWFTYLGGGTAASVTYDNLVIGAGALTLGNPNRQWTLYEDGNLVTEHSTASIIGANGLAIEVAGGSNLTNVINVPVNQTFPSAWASATYSNNSGTGRIDIVGAYGTLRRFVQLYLQNANQGTALVTINDSGNSLSYNGFEYIGNTFTIYVAQSPGVTPITVTTMTLDAIMRNVMELNDDNNQLNIESYSGWPVNITSGYQGDVNINAGDDIFINAGNKTISDSTGGQLGLNGGNGGDADTQDPAGSGGGIDMVAGDGGVASNTYGAGNGGYTFVSGGNGGSANATGSQTAGIGGSLVLYAGSAGGNDGNQTLGQEGGNVEIQAGYATGNYTGGFVSITAGQGGIGQGSGNIRLTTQSFNHSTSYNLVLDNTGSLTLPTINVDTGLDEQAIFSGQRKIIPANRYSAVINGTTPTVVYTASSSSIGSLKMTISMEHSGLGLEMFDISAMAAGANVMYSVSNRLNGTGQPDTTVSVDYIGGGPVSLAVTLTVNSGATTSWVTYDSTEFGYQVD